MGFTISVLACAHGHKDAFLRVACLRDTGEPDLLNEAPMSGASDGRHFFVWRNTHQVKLFGRPDYKLISRTAPFYCLDVVESVNSLNVIRYEAGEKAWCINGGTTGYAELGTPPFTKDDLIASYLNYARKTHEVEDDEYDSFGLAGEALALPTGFRYHEATGLNFTALEGDLPYAKPWWKFW
ncbi:hypothetical protein [Yoonia sp. SDW83-1]|uniref:hypothetical protein n=1 Tax=Yoonia sp. SDW83-1 TaxID=3366945 RepID=UPI00398C47CC